MTENGNPNQVSLDNPRGWTLISSWLAVVAIGLCSFAIIFLVPKFVAIFEEMVATLPTMTVLLISLSRFVSNWFLLLMFPIVGFVIYLLVGRPVSLIRVLSVFVIVTAVLFFLIVMFSLLLPMQQLIQGLQ